MKNGPLQTECQVLNNVVESASESELGAPLHNRQTTIPLRITLKDLGHQKYPTPIESDNYTELGILNSTVK